MTIKLDLILQGKSDSYTAEIAEYYLSLDFVNKIIISCWKNDAIDTTSNIITILKSDDVEFPGVGNRNRQIKSSLEGLKLATTDFSVKLRSDQKISLDSVQLMFDFYEKNKQQAISFHNGLKPKNRICVAGIFKPFPFHPRDHIFWGNTQDLIDVFNIPYDNTSKTDDYTKYTRAETYIGVNYCVRFDNEISNYINEPIKYLVDNAPKIKKTLIKSDYLTPQVFKPFPKINLEWPKYNLKNYHYDLTASQFGEYWDE